MNDFSSKAGRQKFLSQRKKERREHWKNIFIFLGFVAVLITVVILLVMFVHSRYISPQPQYQPQPQKQVTQPHTPPQKPKGVPNPFE